MPRCRALKPNGERCRNPGDPLCGAHRRAARRRNLAVSEVVDAGFSLPVLYEMKRHPHFVEDLDEAVQTLRQIKL